MSFDVQQFYKNLEKFYWSPRHPNDYVIKLYGKTVGIGIVAGQDYAAFNYAWAVTPQSLDSEEGQRAATLAFAVAKQVTVLEVGDSNMFWHMTRQSLPQFKQWYAANWKSLPPEAFPLLRKLYKSDEVQALL